MSSMFISRAFARRSTRASPSPSSTPSAAPATLSEPAIEPGGRRPVLRLLRTNAFRLAVLYIGIFATSVLALLVFIYWSTANFVEQQTEATLDAEIAGLAGGVFMSRNMLRRVEAVSNTAASIIHGDLGKRVPLSGSGDEFDQLAANLNAMLDQIERLMVGMRQVTDNIAHDLRTPLARLRSRLEVTLLERPDAARCQEVVRETIAEADQLLGTFTALLSIAEAEAGSARASMA